MASFQAPTASGSELPLAISREEAAARQSAGLFTPALGALSSHRLMLGSGCVASAAGRDQHGGLSNEPSYNTVGRDMMARGEEFVGLYTGLGRLSAGFEGCSTNLISSNPGMMNVGATDAGVSQAGAKAPAIMSFVGGEFRLQGMGREMEEDEGEGIDSMQSFVEEREGEDDAERGEPSWQQGDPNVQHGMLQRERSAAQELQQELRAEARAVKELPGLLMGGGTDHHRHQQQQRAAMQAHQLALMRVSGGGEGGGRNTGIGAELDPQAHEQHSQQLLEQQQKRELMMRSQRAIVASAGTASGGSTMACCDCGNQAKKDCPHMRCRTCCKSRGFECATHVKSTWVPVSKRRQRMQQAGLLVSPSTTASGEQQQQQQQRYQDNFKLARSVKRARTLSLTAGGGSSSTMAHAAAATAATAPSRTSTSTGTPPRSSDINSAPPTAISQEAQVRGGLFPPEFTTQAVFRCVRITGMMDGQDEYAYQTEVRIGGHVFKGILHDQGADQKSDFATSNIAELQLGGRNVPSSAAALMDLSGLYTSAGGNAMLGAFR